MKLYRVSLLGRFVCTALTVLSFVVATEGDTSQTEVGSTERLYRLSLLELQLTDQREVRVVLNLRCNHRSATECPTSQLVLNLTRSVGLYTWSESNSSSLRREAESALCQFSGRVVRVESAKFTFASINLCRGPFGFIDTGRRPLFMRPWPLSSLGLNVTADAFTAAPGSKEHLEKAFRAKTILVLLSDYSKPENLTMSQISPGDPFAGRRCVARAPPDEGRYKASNRVINQPASHRRVPRSTTSDATIDEIVNHRFVEILFVVDSSIVAFHQNILDDFVFGILGIAQGMFRDPQLEENIELSLASIYRLTTEEEAKIMTRATDQVASDVLDSFNSWTATLHQSRFGQSVSWDISVLLTRKYLFSFVDYNGHLNKDPVLGITTYRSMCEMQRNGILLQEIGLQSGFSLAHELGHTFNMYHDDSVVCSRKLYPNEANGNYIMDSSLHPSTYPWTWSICSKLHLRKFFRTSQSDCTRQRSQPVVLHQQKSRRSSANRFYPRFTVDEQCQLLFGAEASQCDATLKACGILWCRVSVSQNKSICWSKKVVWAPGTPCGVDKICLDGECVAEIHGAINGGWSQWSEWTKCSADCGGGVRWRRRFCDNPRPRRGGAFCHGQRAVVETCGRGACLRTGTKAAPSIGDLGSGTTARDAQCADFAFRQQLDSNQLSGGSGGMPAKIGQQEAFALHPRLSSTSRCSSVTCSVHSMDIGTGPRLARIFTVDRVRDGAPCHPFDYGVCIGGVCQPTGCDGVLNSDKRWDVCGVCGGRNETCHLKTRSLTVNITYESSYLYTFSQGSSSIKLTTTGGSGRFCTFEIQSSNVSSGTWKSAEALYLNGNAMKTNLGVSIAQSQSRKQSIFETGHYLQILSSATPQHLEEEYLVSGVWIVLVKREGDWHLHGIGRLANNLSIRISSVEQEGQTAAASVKKEIGIESQEFVPNLRIRASVASECSRRCQGRQSLEHVCEDISEVSGVKRLPLSVCLEASPPLFIPPLPPYKSCNTHCRIEWRLVPGNCSSRCGRGKAVDRYDCVLSQDDGSPDVVLAAPTDVKEETNYCTHRSVRLLQRECTGQCQPVAWRLGPWSSCSKTCGSGGTRSRLAVCEELDKFGNRQWPNSECQHLPLPGNLVDSCGNHLVECPQWKVSEWSSCDAYCADGFERRSVYCRWKSDPAPPELCPSEVPITERSCKGRCLGRWRAGNWSQCHMPCQNGRRFRQVDCIIGDKKVNALNCPRASRPNYLQDCSNQCVHWVYTNYGQCSATCGSVGRQARQALCANASNHLISSADCINWIGPATDTLRPCSDGLQPLPDCPGPQLSRKRYDWRVADWSNCSQSCGPDGVRYRRVDCLDLDSNKTVAERQCTKLAQKPSSAEACNRQISCPYWVFNHWSICLTECDQGVQLRSVECHQNAQIVDEQLCNQTIRPIDLRPCNSTIQCPSEWTSGKWSECSQSCGDRPGIRLRQVSCQSSTGRPVSESSCAPERRPSGLMECGQQPCPTWKPTAWSECLGLCGTGIRTRDLQCRWSNGSLARDETECASEPRPAIQESCQLEKSACQWRVGPWSSCRLTAAAVCNSGIRRGHRHRTVQCQRSDGGQVLPDALCIEQRLRRPRTRRRCRLTRHDVADNADVAAACGSIRKRHASANGSSILSVGANYIDHQAYRIGPWTDCSTKCGRGYQTRRIIPCNATDAESVMNGCRQSRRRPRSRRRCFLAFCPYDWTAEPWSACSASCGRGLVTRRVTCQRFTLEGWRDGPAGDAANACDERLRPDSEQACRLGDCPGFTGSGKRGPFWELGDFGACRYSNGLCGEGERRRRVLCSLKTGQFDDDVNVDGPDFCPPDEKPPERDACEPRRCHARSCAELKSMTRIKLDGQYRLRINEQDVRVYCFGMDTRNPREYITLSAAMLTSADRSAGQNFAVMHNIGLTDPAPSACPPPSVFAGFSRAACSQPGAMCRIIPDRLGSFASGMTVFKKLRLLLSPRLEVDATDDTFAVSWKSFVPAGRAGDCFSTLAGCSIGSFSIDLTGTDFALDRSGNSWLSQNATTMTVSYLDRHRVQGICGGLCGYCKLDKDRLQLITLVLSANPPDRVQP